ncbi:MAG TPA: hypothetical protein VFW09_14815 [Solirubrobacteraceae bacterium]|nr:hypothetical protein [Solirubrobacteraceae bacterium]
MTVSQRSDGATAPKLDRAYYTVANAPYFLGTVALLNSLRRVGEDGALVVVDCGLTEEQRELLSTRATVVDSEPGLHPLLQKARGPYANPAKVMVFIDADILVTRALDPIARHAQTGRVVVFEDYGNPDRHFTEWSSLGLGQVPRRPYVNSGLFAFSWQTADELLPIFLQMQQSVDVSSTFKAGGSPSHPLYFADQDLLNALLCTHFDDRTTRLERRLAPFPPFTGIELTAGEPGLCTYADGAAPFVLHHTYRKPWLASLEPNLYSRVFTILMNDPDACLPIDPRRLPLRLTNRRLAPVDRWRAATQHAVHGRVRGKLKLRPRIARARARLAG